MTPLERIRAQLAVLNERREKVVKGRWKYDPEGYYVWAYRDGNDPEIVCSLPNPKTEIENGSFIAASPTEHELLAKAVERLVKVLDEIDLGGRGFYQGTACSSLAREALADVAELLKGGGKS